MSTVESKVPAEDIVIAVICHSPELEDIVDDNFQKKRKAFQNRVYLEYLANDACNRAEKAVLELSNAKDEINYIEWQIKLAKYKIQYFHEQTTKYRTEKNTARANYLRKCDEIDECVDDEFTTCIAPFKYTYNQAKWRLRNSHREFKIARNKLTELIDTFEQKKTLFHSINEKTGVLVIAACKATKHLHEARDIEARLNLLFTD